MSAQNPARNALEIPRKIGWNSMTADGKKRWIKTAKRLSAKLDK